jgi:MarR family transcriptional regulator, transcriptional regulator for hemolysin
MNVGREFAMELGRVWRKWRARLDARVKHLGLTQARWIALLQLRRSGPLSQRDLAEQIGVEGPTLVRLLDGLQQGGLIERTATHEDRRVKKIHLTASAYPLIEEITRISDALREELMESVPPEDLATAHRVLRLIGDRLERL